MDRYEYTRPDGRVTLYDTADDAMKAYAADAFPADGSIRKVDEDAPAREVDHPASIAAVPGYLSRRGFAAVILDFADASADLVTDAGTLPAEGNDEVRGGWTSYYRDEDRAREIHGWVESWAPGETLLLLTREVDAGGDEEDAGSAGDADPEPADPEPADPEPTSAGPVEILPAPFHRDGGPRTVAAAQYSDVAAARIEENDRWLAAIGVTRPPGPVTTAGIRRGNTVVDLGYRNLATRRRSWDAQPTVGEQADTIASAVRAEEREDWTVDTRSLHMRDDGTIDTDHGRLSVEPQGFAALLSFLRTGAAERHGTDAYWPSPAAEAKARQLAALDEDDPAAAHGLFPRAASVLLALDPDVRAYTFNRQVAYAASREIVVRNRVADGPVGRACFAATSTGYTAFDADEVASTVADGLERLGLAEMRGEGLYSPDTTYLRMDATLHAPPDVVDFAAGDAFKVGLRFRSDDSGGGSIRGGGIAWWNECYNLVVIHHARGGDILRLVHKGSLADIDRALRAGLDAAADAQRHFARQWGLLRESDIRGFSFRGETFASVEDAVRFLVSQRELDGVMARDVLAEYVLTAHGRQGGGDTLASIVDAFTRAAHEALVAECVRERIEGAAGRLVPVLARAAEA